jgi:hypothetical protein
MRTMPHVRCPALVGALLAVTALSSCSSQGILHLSQDEITKPACTTTQEIPAGELAGTSDEACRAVGSTIVFASGDRITNEGGSGSVAAAGDGTTMYAYVDVGDYGVVAGRYSADCTDVETWGAVDAITKVHDAFGDRWPCDQE